MFRITAKEKRDILRGRRIEAAKILITKFGKKPTAKKLYKKYKKEVDAGEKAILYITENCSWEDTDFEEHDSQVSGYSAVDVSELKEEMYIGITIFDKIHKKHIDMYDPDFEGENETAALAIGLESITPLIKKAFFNTYKI